MAIGSFFLVDLGELVITEMVATWKVQSHWQEKDVVLWFLESKVIRIIVLYY